MRMAPFFLALAAVAMATPTGELPDVIVTHLSSTPTTVSVHLQNQGPGTAAGLVHLAVSRRRGGQPVVRVDVPAPQGLFAVGSSQPIPLQSLGVDSHWSSELIRVEVNADQPQARKSNKDFYEQIERRAGVIHNGSLAYGERHPDLPDLVIERVYYDAPNYIKVVYANRGRGRTGADFLVGLRTAERKFPENYYYRFRVPAVGESRTTGGFTLGILGLKPGMKAPLTVSLDPEGRVRETDTKNNTWTGTLDLR